MTTTPSVFSLVRVLACSVAVSAAACPHGVQARGEEPWQPVLTSVAGEWVLSVHGDHVMTSGLELAQDGTRVTGKMFVRGTVVPVDGEYVDRRLTLTIDEAIRASHGKKDVRGGPIEVTATMKDDGTLEGEMQSGGRRTRITAERFARQAHAGASAALAG